MNIIELPNEIITKIAECMDTETLSISAFSFYEHEHTLFSTQLMSRIERLRAFCTILRDTCVMTDLCMFIDPSRVLPYHADKAYWSERDFRLVAKVFMENKLFPPYVIVYVAAMWGYTDYADQLMKESESENSSDLKAYVYHGAGMGGDVSFKAQEIENDFRELVGYYFSGQLANDLNGSNQMRLQENVMLSMVYMSGLICRGHVLSSEGRQRVADLLSGYNNIPNCGKEATRTAIFAALLSGDTQYAVALRPSIAHEEIELLEAGGMESFIESLEAGTMESSDARIMESSDAMTTLLAVALQLRRQQEALRLLEVLSPYYQIGGFPDIILECAVRQQLDVFVQAYLDRSVGPRREEAIKSILRVGSDDFIGRLRLGDVTEAENDLQREVLAMLRDVSSPNSLSVLRFERYVMGLDARRELQLRYGPDADIDEMYKKADRLAYARITQHVRRRSEKWHDSCHSEKMSDKKSLATKVLCAGLVLAVSAVCAALSTSGMRLSK